MFKEILVFMLWLQFSNGSWESWGSGIIEDNIGKVNKGTSCKENAIEFLEETYYLAGGTIPATISKICILSNHQGEDIQEPPDAALSHTSIYVEISEIQIKRIRKYSMEISFYFKVKWVDQRLQVLQFIYPSNRPFNIDKNKQDRIWIPHLKMGPKMISEEVEVDYVMAEIRKMGNFSSGAWVTKKIHVTTEVACKLDFRAFPFDHHECSIEVRLVILMLKYTFILNLINCEKFSLRIKRMKLSLKVSIWNIQFIRSMTTFSKILRNTALRIHQDLASILHLKEISKKSMVF